MKKALVVQARINLPEVPEEFQGWKSALESWFTILPENTCRAYKQAWRSLLAHSKKMPWEIVRNDVAGWVAEMTRSGRKPATIQQRLAGISSFYQFLQEDPSMKVNNPASGKTLRPKREKYQGAHVLEATQIKQLLGAIDRNTIQGSRDYALFLFYVFTGRRNTEIRTLKWGDIETVGMIHFYRWSGKGKSRQDELPMPVWEAITDHLILVGRIEQIKSDHYIFQALSDAASHLPNVCAQTSNPLSAHEVGRLLKGYCEKAGLNPIRVHDLRHSAAMLRVAAGDSEKKVQDQLDHSNLSTTNTYIHTLQGRRDEGWMRVGELLGIKDQEVIHKSKVARRLSQSRLG